MCVSRVLWATRKAKEGQERVEDDLRPGRPVTHPHRHRRLGTVKSMHEISTIESDGSNPIPPRSRRAGRRAGGGGQAGKNMIIWIKWETPARRLRLACCRKMLSEIQDEDKRIYGFEDQCSLRIY